jgi:O-antigen ligase
MDFRSLGAICLVASAIVFTKSSERTPLRACYLILLGAALVGGAGTLYWSLTSSAEKYAVRRSESNSLRLADYEAIVTASSRSPFIGAGSWATNSEIVSLMSGSLTQAAGRSKRTNELAELPGHSQLLQVWYEAGLLGLSFFVFFTFKLMRAIWLCTFHAPLSPLFPLTLVYSMFSLWHVLFSPFAGAHRVHIAISAVMLMILARPHRVPRRSVTYVSNNVEQPSFRPARSLSPA